VTAFLDFHTHPWLPEHLAPGTRDFIRSVSPAVREHGDALREPRYAADVLRAQGCAGAVVLAEHCPQTSGSVRTESVLAYCAGAPGFFIPFASVDPVTDAEPAALLRDYLDAGARGLKLYPSYQFFYPDDPRAYPLYAICEERGVPVLMHIGSSVIPGTRLKYCDPVRLDDLAVDFPALTLVMAHGGRGFWYDACSFLARHHAGFYIDVAGLPPSDLPRLFPRLDRLAPKLIFGSDWPAMPKSAGANAAAVADVLRAALPADAADGVIADVLGGTMARLLRLAT
jgi:predicted TIM-barrel fold metal-dependent hydrolase